MSHFASNLLKFNPPPATVVAAPRPSGDRRHGLVFVLGLAMLAISTISFAESRAGTTGARASIDFRIVIPAIIRITSVSQPDHILIEAQHVTQGFIDLDAGTTVRLTVNTRDGYLLAARYDSKLLSGVEVRVSSQTLTSASGFGSMRVASALAVDALVPISYRLHLAPGVQAGNYRWPVALAFSLAMA